MPKRLGIVPHAFAQPLIHGLQERQSPAAQSFELVVDSSVQLAIKLRQGNLDGAFLSPIDYAKEYSRYSLVPDVGVVSQGESGSVLLLFQENRSDIKTIAVDGTSSSEIVLAHLVMAEKFDITPQIVPMKKSPEEALQSADAALVVGNTALAMKDREQKLDLVDEWLDITGMPYVHGLWTVRPESLALQDVQPLIESGLRGDIVKEQEPFRDNNEMLEQFHYSMSDEDITALNEFFRMAFYHGILKDIPDVKFLSRERSSSGEVSVR